MQSPTLTDEVAVFLNRLMVLNDVDHIESLAEFCQEPCIWITTQSEKPLSTHAEILSWLSYQFSRIEIIDAKYELQRCQPLGDLTLAHVLYKLNYYYLKATEKLLFLSVRASYVLSRKSNSWKIELAHFSVADDLMLHGSPAVFPDPFSDF